jgi:4a-hydroxytetrahydrobiopterin dehydratase
MEKLTNQKCTPCEGGIAPLKPSEYQHLLGQLAGWVAIEDKKIERRFQFKDFVEALKFVNYVGGVAENEGHHPDILIHDWNKVVVTLWTHAIGGLSLNDFIVAGKIDLLIKK